MSSTLSHILSWKEICEKFPNKDMPYQMETDDRGNVIMSPMYARHGFFQAEISFLLKTLYPNGIVVTECAVKTSSGTKVSDVALFSKERWREVKEDYDVHLSPEIAIEILSPSNSLDEIESKRNLYFEAGSLEFWICDLEGNLHFFNKQSRIPKSEIVTQFPLRIEEF
jgi:Uma2 family endonuclease